MKASFILIIIIVSAICSGIASMVCVGPLWVVWMLRGVTVIQLIVALFFRRKIIRPLHSLMIGADLLKGRDFSSRLAPTGQPEMDNIIRLFNSMMASMRTERLKMREQDRLLDRVLEVSPLGVIMVDGNDRISLLNPTAIAILEPSNPGMTTGMKLSDLHGTVAETLGKLSRDESTELRLTDSNIFRLSRHGFMDSGYEHPFYLIEMLTDEVRRAERSSYGKAIRIMSHEVNNLMAGVTSTLDTLTPIFSETEPDIAESLHSCSDRCKETASFIARLAKAVKIPAPMPMAVDVNMLLSDKLPLLQSLCSRFGVSFESLLPGRRVMANLDPVLMEQVMVNIVKNAAESASTGSENHPCVKLKLSPLPHPTITVEDNGPGISPEVSRQLFTPFFTTRPSGHGIGLTVVSEILTAHGFRFSLATPHPGSTIFTIRL
ncbi:MAG: HAMP domain-containing protein [Duncaniella sp.]|nr:HAMP domain-containing protein [Duncaniella sp.]